MEKYVWDSTNKSIENLNFSNCNDVQLIKRKDLKCIKEMNVDGERTYLGEVRNFKSHCFLDQNIPSDISISWSALGPDDVLKEHYHPCDSFLIITEGHGVSTGDSQVSFKAGDIIYIPKWNLHGFVGGEGNGFKALSIQFQKTAIFESESNTETTYFDRESVPLDQREIQIIHRAEIPSITETTINGVTHQLGELKNFSSIKLLEKLFPLNFSCAWVRLRDGESLKPHTHQEDSMIIITEGDGQFVADYSFNIESGDILYIPTGVKHGFRSDTSFWGLSIQFNRSSLYQNVEAPRVKFKSDYQLLLEKNERIATKFYEENKVFKIARDVLNLRGNKEILLESLQVMSDHFQRLMFLRVGLCESRAYRKVFMEHFMEELGHDLDLYKERKKTEKKWDPVLEAACSWFVHKNFLLDNAGRTVMVQMVLEKCAGIFYGHFSEILTQNQSSHHINAHKEADEGHDLMGLHLLEHESPTKFKDLFKLQEESWSIMELYISRIAEIIESQESSKHLTKATI